MSRAGKEIAVRFGAALKVHREAKQLSQSKLAKLTHTNRTFISQIERGIRQPSLTTICRLAAGLHVHPAQLIEHAIPAEESARDS